MLRTLEFVTQGKLDNKGVCRMTSLYKFLELPDALSVGCVSVSFILAVAPFLEAGLDFGIFKIPKLPDGVAKPFKVGGPVLFVISILGFIPLVPTSNNTEPSVANDAIAWWKVTDETRLVQELHDAFRLYLELRAGIVQDSCGVPRCHVFLGVTSNSPVPPRNMVLHIQPKPKDAKTPSIMAFVLRDKHGYHTLADDFDASTGMPKDTKAVKQQKTWRIPSYAEDEQLKIVLFVIPDTDDLMAEFNLVNAEDIIDVQFTEQ